MNSSGMPIGQPTLADRIRRTAGAYQQDMAKGVTLAELKERAETQLADILRKEEAHILTYTLAYGDIAAQRDAMEKELGFNGDKIKATNSAHAIEIIIHQYAQMEALDPTVSDFQEYLTVMYALPKETDPDKFRELVSLDIALYGISIWADRMEQAMKN